ncbi:MAG: tetratricopeptide repeat protein [Polyangiaceae bacterium]
MCDRDRIVGQRAPLPGARARRGLACTLALWLSTFGAPALADASSSPDLARSVAVAGREAYNAGDYKTALDLFRRAFGMYPAPTLSLYEARSLAKLGRLREADEALKRTLALPVDPSAPAQFSEAIETARQERQALARRIPSLTIKVVGVEPGEQGLVVSLDQQALGASQLGKRFALDPGTYSVSAATNDGRKDELRVEIGEGRHVDAVLHLEGAAAAQMHAALPESPSDDSWQPVLVYSSLGLGVAGLGTGIVTGIMAGSKHSKARELCPDEECAPGSEGEQALSSFRTLRTVSTISYGVGVAGITAGIILWLSLPDSNAAQVSSGSIRPWLTGRYAGIEGEFY